MLEESILRDSEITLIHVQHMVNEELVGMYDEVYEL